MKNCLLLLISLSCVFHACQQPTQPLDQAAWILGTWEQRTSKGSLYERWQTRDAHTFAATSFYLRAGDTVILETVNLIEEAGQLYYIPVVNNQNDGSPIPFTLQEISPSHMVFENLDHDFPQHIAYRRVKQDSLVATISGRREGKTESRNFPMRRMTP